MGDQAIAEVADLLAELDAAALELGTVGRHVVAVKGDVGGPGGRSLRPAGGVAPQVRFGQVEDQPAAADVRAGEAQLVAEEGPEFLGLGGIEHRVYPANHR